MRRTVLGLAATAVVAGVLGFGGAAHATASYVLLNDTTTVLTSGDLNWAIDLCSGTNVACGNLAMRLSGNGVVISGFQSGSTPSFPSLGSVATATPADFTVDVEEFTTSRHATITAASMLLSGADTLNAGGQVYVGPYPGGTPVASGANSVGDAASGFPQQIGFSGENDIYYAADIHFGSSLNTVTLGQPIPEPSGLGILAVAMVLTVAASRRRAVR